MKPSEVLIAAANVIADPENWCQNWFALNEEGQYEPDIQKGKQFCAVGAVAYVLGIEGEYTFKTEAARHLNTAAQRLTAQWLQDAPTYNNSHSHTTYNNSHSHTDVMNMFYLAIQIAKEHENE
jgi:hypothetical protein